MELAVVTPTMLRHWSVALRSILPLFTDERLDVFLMGAEAKKRDSMRARVNKQLLKWRKVRVHYPEEMFSEIMNNDRVDLLQLEAMLARSVHAIVICVESWGSAVELGAFALNDDLAPRIVVINGKEHEPDRSFINLGPIKHIRYRKGRLIWVQSDAELPEEFADKLKDDIRSVAKKAVVSQGLDNLVVAQAAVLLLVSAFEPVAVPELIRMLGLIGTSGLSIGDLCQASVESLTGQGSIRLDAEGYVLTDQGYESLRKLSRAPVVKIFDDLRAEVLCAKLKKKRSFGERAVGS